MDNMKELNLNEMENVSGGRLLVVNTGIEGVIEDEATLDGLDKIKMD